MMSASPIPILILALVSGQEESSRAKPDAFASGAVSELSIGRAPGSRVLYFRLDRAQLDEARRKETPLGVARWMRTPGRGFGEHRSELEIYFFDSRTRLSHIETMLPGERRLLWREVRPQGGRTLLLDGASSAGFSIVDTNGGEVRRSEIDAERGLLPLEIVEAARKGQVYMGSFSIFQPLAGGFETLQLRTRRSRDAHGYGLRDLLITEPDGTQRASYRFRRGELFEFGWRQDGPRARRVSEEEFARWMQVQAPVPARGVPEPTPRGQVEAPILDGPHPKR